MMELPPRNSDDGCPQQDPPSPDPPSSPHQKATTTTKGYVSCSVVSAANVMTQQELFENNDFESNNNLTTTTENTEECRICLGELQDALSLECGHEFCQECVASHCGCQALLPILCPDETCEVPIPVRLLRLLLQPDRLQELVKRYRARRDSSHLKCCPLCDELLRLPLSKNQNDLECGNCKRTFCRIHDTEHLNVLCKNHIETVQTIGNFSKPCSHCGTYLQKSAGCDHVVCKYCNGDFCWKCGTHEYLSGKVRKKCSNCGFNLLDYRYEDIHRRRLLLWMPLILPLSVIYSVLMMAVCLVSLCCCGCLCWGDFMATGERPGLRGGTMLTLTVVFLPFLVLLNDFGVMAFEYLDEIIPIPEYQQNEIPFLETADTTADSI